MHNADDLNTAENYNEHTGCSQCFSFMSKALSRITSLLGWQSFSLLYFRRAKIRNCLPVLVPVQLMQHWNAPAWETMFPCWCSSMVPQLHAFLSKMHANQAIQKLVFDSFRSPQFHAPAQTLLCDVMWSIKNNMVVFCCLTRYAREQRTTMSSDIHVASFKQNHQLAGVAKLFSIVLQEGEDPKLAHAAHHLPKQCPGMKLVLLLSNNKWPKIRSLFRQQ